jgi:hypothetical protein
VLQDEVAADRTELERIAGREQRQAADAEADRSALASQRWADSAPRDEAPPDEDEAPPDEEEQR